MTEENVAEVVDNEVAIDADNAEAVKAEAKEETAQEENQDEGQDDDVFEPFPKKARNAISRRDKQIAKLRAELRELQQARQETPKAEAPKDAAPKEADFDTYAEFLEAKTLYRVQQELKKQQEASQKTERDQRLTAEQVEYIRSREALIDQKHVEYEKSIPDYSEVYAENGEVVNYLPDHVKHAFLEADDAALAFYNLAKGGELDALFDASPAKAAAMIARAQSRPAVVKTNAPKPIRGVSGKGKPGKSLSEMSEDELIKKFIRN